MSGEDNKPRVAVPMKPPPRVLKAAPNGNGGVGENKGVGNGGMSNEGGVKFRPVSESFAKHDLEKGQVMFKLPPRQKDGADTTNKTVSAPNLFNNNTSDGRDEHTASTSTNNNGVGGSFLGKPAPPRRGPVSPPVEGEAKHKPSPPAPGGTGGVTSPPPSHPSKGPLLKAKPSPTSTPPTSPPIVNNDSPTGQPPQLKKAAPRPALRPPPPSDDSSPPPPPPSSASSPSSSSSSSSSFSSASNSESDSGATSQFAKARAALAADLTAENLNTAPPPPIASSSPSPSPAPAPSPPHAPTSESESSATSQFAKARAALAADLTAESLNTAPPPPTAAPQAPKINKLVPPRVEPKEDPTSSGKCPPEGPSAALSPPPAKPRALKPAAAVGASQESPGDAPPPQPKPMAKKVSIQAADPAETTGDQPQGGSPSMTAKVGYRKSVMPAAQSADNSFAAKAAHRMSLPASELNRVSGEPPATQLKPAPRPLAPVVAPTEPASSDVTPPAPKPAAKKISFPPNIQDNSERADTTQSQKVGFRKSSFPPAGQDVEQSTATTQAQKAAFRVSSFHPPSHDSDKLPPFAQPLKPKPMARKVAPSTEQQPIPAPANESRPMPPKSTTPPPDQANQSKPAPPTETLSTSGGVPPPTRPKPFALKSQTQKVEEEAVEDDSAPAPILPPRPKPGPRQFPPQTKPDESTAASPPAADSNASRPISPPPRVKPPASKPPPTSTEPEAAPQIGRIKMPAFITNAEGESSEQGSTTAPADKIEKITFPPPVSSPPIDKPTPAPRIIRPVSVAFQPVSVATSPEPPRAKHAPKAKPAAIPPTEGSASAIASPPVSPRSDSPPPPPPPTTAPPRPASPPPASSVTDNESTKSVAPPRPPKQIKRPSEVTLGAESTSPVLEAESPQPTANPLSPQARQRKILGSPVSSDLASSGGMKKLPARQPPPDTASQAELHEPAVEEQLPTEVLSPPPPFPARPKRSAPKPPSALTEAPSSLPPPPPPIEAEEAPKSMWVAPELPPPIALDPRPRVRAVFDYEAQAEGQLTFPSGAIMYVVERTNEGYMGCEYNGAIGWVINSYIEEIGVETAPPRLTQRHTTQLLGHRQQQPAPPPEPSPRQATSPISPRQVIQPASPISPRQFPPQRPPPIQRQLSPPVREEVPPPPPSRQAPPPVREEVPPPPPSRQPPPPVREEFPPPPPPAQVADDSDDEDVGSKLDMMATSGPRLANPKRAGPRRGARPPTRGAAPKIKTKTTTDDAATGPRADLSGLGGSGGIGVGTGAGDDGLIAPRKIIAPGNPSMNIAALAIDQKSKLKTVQQRESVALAHPNPQHTLIKAQYASTGSLPVHPPSKVDTEETTEKQDKKDKKSKGLFGMLGSGKKKKEKS